MALALLGLMCSAPFLQPRHTHPITSFYSEWFAYTLGAAALVCATLGWRDGRARPPRIALVPLLLAAVVLVQWLVLDLPYIQPAMLAAGCLLWAAALTVVGAAVREALGPERVAVALAWFIVAGALLNASAALTQYYLPPGSLEPWISTRLGLQVYGNLGQPNHFASQLALAFASLALLYALGRVRTTVAVTLCVPLLFALSLSGSRSAWLYLIAFAALAALANRLAPTFAARKAFLFSLGLLPGFAVANLAAVSPWLASFAFQTTVDRWLLLWASPSDRLLLWREAWSIFAANPLLGAGWGQFSWQYFASGGSTKGTALTGYYNHAHNALLQLLAETGLAGTAIVITGVALWLSRARGLLNSVAGWWVCALLAVLAIHSMLEYPLWNAYFLGIAAVLLGLGEQRVGMSSHRVWRRSLAMSIAVVASTAGVMLLRDYRAVEIGFATRSAAPLSEAAARSSLLRPYAELADAERLAADAHGLDDNLALTARVIRHAPTGAIAYRYSMLLALAGDDATAREFLRRAVVRYPDLLREFITEMERTTAEENDGRRAHLEAMRTLLMRQNTAVPEAAQ